MPGKTKKKKRATKKSGTKQQELKQSLSDLRAQLTKTEKKLAKANNRAERWKKEAKAQERSAARAGAQTEKPQQEQSEAVVALAPVQADAEGVAVPDESWTVAQPGPRHAHGECPGCRTSRRRTCSTPCPEPTTAGAPRSQDSIRARARPATRCPPETGGALAAPLPRRPALSLGPAPVLLLDGVAALSRAGAWAG